MTRNREWIVGVWVGLAVVLGLAVLGGCSAYRTSPLAPYPAVAEEAAGNDALAALAQGGADELWVLVRPEGVRLGESATQMAEVQACRLLGATTLVHLSLPDGAGDLLHIHARLPPGRRLARGERVTVGLDPERAFVFPPEAT